MSIRAYVAERTDAGLSTGVRTLSSTELGAGDVEIDVAWSGINFKDTMVTTAGNRVARSAVLVPGVDLAGTVTAAPSDSGLSVGDNVIAHGFDLGVSHHGGFATAARVPAQWVVPLPAGLDLRTAMAIGTAGFTAVLSVIRLEQAGCRPESGPVLVTGATGGVGSVAIAALAARGFEVIASSGKGPSEYLRELGAGAVVGRDEIGDLPDRVLGSERYAGAVDCVGGATLAQILRSLRYGGVVAASGLVASSELVTTVYPFIVRAVQLIGIDTVLTPVDERARIWAQVTNYLAPATIERLVHAEVGLDALEAALSDVREAKVVGRILVEPSR